jgi:hypothetical protein
MAEDIGNLLKTKIPSLSEVADIQEALRLYHYGAPSGVGVDDYDTNNSVPSNLKPNSIAGHLQALDNRISGFQSGIQPSVYSSKGSLLTSRGVGPLFLLEIDSSNEDGQVLTLSASSTGGFNWQTPQVTPANTINMSNKTFLASFISAGGLGFKGSGSFVTTLIVQSPTENRTITIPNATTTLVGTDTLQTLTNKTIDLESSSNTITGTLAIENGGTNAATDANARANLKIFNTTTGSFSGKIYVVDPTLAGAGGINLPNPQAGDLWFW